MSLSTEPPPARATAQSGKRRCKSWRRHDELNPGRASERARRAVDPGEVQMWGSAVRWIAVARIAVVEDDPERPDARAAGMRARRPPSGVARQSHRSRPGAVDR